MDKFLTKYNAELIKAIFKEIEKGTHKKSKNVTALVLQLKRNNKIIYIDATKC